VVISNCVINLSTDKSAVIGEMFRVLTPGGRLGISDVVAEDDLSPADRAERGSYVVNCRIVWQHLTTLFGTVSWCRRRAFGGRRG
jgi:ubiquinone/menaquinone biosynthesis C-methylase UbiE